MRRKEVPGETGQAESVIYRRPALDRVVGVRKDRGGLDGHAPGVYHGGERVATLASHLSDPRIQSAQRYAIAAELGRSLGNRQLARLLDCRGAADGVHRATTPNRGNLGVRSPSELQPAKTSQRKLSNAAVRLWYLKRVALTPILNQLWLAMGMTAEQRARAAYDYRHQARIQARAMMADRVALKRLRARDTKKYGNPDGPTFEWLVKKHKAQGSRGDAIYEAIIRGASKTDPKTNRRFGVTSKED